MNQPNLTGCLYVSFSNSYHPAWFVIITGFPVGDWLLKFHNWYAAAPVPTFEVVITPVSSFIEVIMVPTGTTFWPGEERYMPTSTLVVSVRVKYEFGGSKVYINSGYKNITGSNDVEPVTGVSLGI